MVCCCHAIFTLNLTYICVQYKRSFSLLFVDYILLPCDAIAKRCTWCNKFWPSIYSSVCLTLNTTYSLLLLQEPPTKRPHYRLHPVVCRTSVCPSVPCVSQLKNEKDRRAQTESEVVLYDTSHTCISLSRRVNPDVPWSWTWSKMVIMIWS